ncbi:hypothetical protein EON64_00665 [archaeon]|nr:MAG: hypothetical protein EON64_00665 [archaeon]
MLKAKMSLETLVFPSLAWAEFSQIISMLSLREIWILGCVNRSAFVTFLREKSYREGRKGQPINKIPRFLFKTSGHDKAALVSYPRSGNSFMRKVLERESGIVTGSDSRPNRTLSASLLKFGYAGEGITDQSVWVVKSHYPERLGYLKFPVARVILLVRNPFDAIQSYFHMGMTNTHDRNLSKEVSLIAFY